MRIGYLGLILTLIIQVGAYEEEYDESMHENANKNVYFELPIFGNGLAFLYPSRVFSIKVDVSNQFGFVVEPIIGHNIIKGFGSTAGFYIRNGKNHNGLKFVFVKIERYGAIYEGFYDYDRYIKTTPGLNLRYGVSAGIGMKQFSENKNEKRVLIDYGPTFRLHLDYSYLLKIN